MNSDNAFILGNREINSNEPPFVIAEIGINHEGDLSKAEQMVHDALRSGAECVKFQCHVVDDEMTDHAKQIIPINADSSIYDIMERCSFSKEEDIYLKELTESLGMIYLSTPFSRKAVDRLVELGVVGFKIGSGECNNYPLVDYIARLGKPVILSTGMNNILSIKESVKIFQKHNTPYALLHCTSLYPTPYDKVRLLALNELSREFPDAVLGLSDHSLGNYTCFAAVALGASILEKHFTSNKTWAGPDIEISIDPRELKDLIRGSNAIYNALAGHKDILAEEQKTIDFAYASVVTIADIKKGELFSEDNLWVKRPGNGEILAKHYNSILGTSAKSSIKSNSQLKWSDV